MFKYRLCNPAFLDLLNLLVLHCLLFCYGNNKSGSKESSRSFEVKVIFHFPVVFLIVKKLHFITNIFLKTTNKVFMVTCIHGDVI